MKFFLCLIISLKSLPYLPQTHLLLSLSMTGIKKGLIEVKEIPYIEETVLDLKKSSIYADDDNDESEKRETQSSWFDSMYKSQKKITTKPLKK